jgi:DNA-binding GntR family transcriptional regulator
LTTIYDERDGRYRGDVLPTVQLVSSVDAAAQALRDAITSGRLAPGERVKEIPMAEQLGVSRGSVREALRQLAEEGLVELVQNQGATVVQLHAHDFMELYALRLALGRLALRHLCTGEPDLEPAASHISRLAEAAKTKRSADAVDADLAFQDALVGAAGLPKTAKIFERTTVQLRAYIALVQIDYGPVLRSIHREDAELLRLVRRQDHEDLLRLWEAKLSHWVQDFVRALDEEYDPALWLDFSGAERG